MMLFFVLLLCFWYALGTDEAFFTAARIGNVAEVTNYLNNGKKSIV